MAEVLAELVAKISADATELKKGLADAEGQTEQSSKRMADSLKKVSMAFVAIGGSIVGSLGMMTKAAADEEANIGRLSLALNNVGVSYNNVKASIEGVITATQRKTGIADDEQRDALGRLLLVTNDFGKAISLLPLALDLAAAGQMNSATAATYLGKALLELEGGAEKVTIRLGQASMQFSSLAEIQERVGGAAQAAANPFKVLGAEISDMGEAVGKLLLPTIRNLVDKFIVVTDKIQVWISANPELTQQLVLVGAAMGIVLTVLGGIGLILPVIVAGFVALTGPIGLISLAIGVLAGTGLYLWLKNSTEVSKATTDLSQNVSTNTQAITQNNNVLTQAQQVAGDYQQSLDSIGNSANNSTKKFRDMINEIKYSYTEAGKFNLTMEDLYNIMVKSGWETQTISQYYDQFGNDISNVSRVLEIMGITAVQAASNVDKLGASYISVAEAARKAGLEQAEAINAATLTARRDVYAGKANIQTKADWAFERLMATQRGYAETGDTERFAPLIEARLSDYYGELEKLSTYKTGGIVPGAIGQPQMAIVHGGEQIIPAESKAGPTIIVQGSLITERELEDIVRQQLYKANRNNYTLGLS